MSKEAFIITVFCLVSDILKQHPMTQRLRTRDFSPNLADAEVITMEIVGEFFGIDTDKGIWSYFKTHWLAWFPTLGSRSAFVRQAANLWRIKQVLQTRFISALKAQSDKLHMSPIWTKYAM